MSKSQIELYSNTSQVMNDAIDRIVVEIHNKKSRGEGAKKILLTGCGPQCGSTSVSIGLGISFAAAKWRTLIVDCDIRKTRDYKKLNEKTENGLSDFLLRDSVNEKEDFEEIVYPTNFENLSYIPCGKYAANPARLFCSGMMKQLLQYVNDNYDYVIFDFPSVAVAPDAQILFGEVDGIILISALDMVTKRQIRDAKLHFGGELHDLRLSLGGVLPVQLAKGDKAADFGKVGVKIGGAGRRDGFPGLQVSIADAFFRVLPVQKNPVGQGVKLVAVGGFRFPDGFLAALKI